MMRWTAMGMWFAAGCATGTEPDPGTERSEPADPQLEGGQYGESEDGECDIVGRTPIAIGDPTPLGFTAQSIADWLTGARDVVVSYEAGGSTPAVLDVQLGATIDLLDLESTETGYATSGCLDALGIGLQITFASDDGAFDEAFDDEALVYVPEAAGFSHPFAAFAGTFDPLAAAGPGYSAVEARLEVGFSPTGIDDGEIDGSGTLPGPPEGLRSVQLATLVEAP